MAYDMHNTLDTLGEALGNANLPVFAAIPSAVCLMLLGLYVACYFKLGDTVTDFGGCLIDRYYYTPWQARIFQPAAWIDAILTGRSVVTSAWRDVL